MRFTARWIALIGAVAVVAGGTAGLVSASHSSAAAFQHLAGGGSATKAATEAHATLTPSASPTPVQTIQVIGAPKGVKAKGAVLADASTGQLLWSRDLETERPMASITKVMTALLVLQGGDLNRELTVPSGVLNYVFEYDGDSAGFKPGEKLTEQDLLEALLVTSAADAAYTFATDLGPGLHAWVARMNAEAAALGMTHTHFTSPDGLPYPTETSTYSTPGDLLTLGLDAMKYPVFRSIVDQQSYHLPAGPGHPAFWWDNTDELLGSYSGAIGIKTGFTDGAGHCLLFAAVRNGRELIGVVLGSPASGPGAGAQDAAKILNWGFALKTAS
jgi:serine-type D-Ala-D-Ala carboxypeptidase (penicillin-binding protein 5/6)